jgi:hypothetical protein
MIQPPNVPGAEPNAPNSPSTLLKPREGAAPPLPSHGGDQDDALSESAIPPLAPRNDGS